MWIQRWLKLLAALAVLAGVGGWFYLKSDRAQLHEEVVFKNYPNLSKEYVDKGPYDRILALHQLCFEGIRREKLLAYYSKQSGLKEPSLPIKEQVNDMIETARTQALTQFRATSNVTLAWIDTKPIGLYTCAHESELTDHSMAIFNVCLDPTYRGKGLGKRMMQHAIERCKQPDLDLTLNVYASDKDVIRLYESLGFVVESPPKPMPDSFYYFDKWFMRYHP